MGGGVVAQLGKRNITKQGLPIYLDRLAAALRTCKGRCQRYPNLSRVYAAKTDGLCAYGIDQFASAAERDFLEISGIARLASGIECLPCRLFHFAAFVVRQAPWIGTDLVGVARLIAIRRVGREIFSLLLAQTSRISKARRLNAASSGRGSALTGCAEAGAIPGMLGRDASTAAPTAIPAPPSSERRVTVVVGRAGDARSASVEMVGWSAMEISFLAGTALDEFHDTPPRFSKGVQRVGAFRIERYPAPARIADAHEETGAKGLSV
jgi:hypothetical protein